MAQTKKRILCVEDDTDTCELMKIVFKNYEVETASSVNEARLLIHNRFFDLYILDNWLGEGSGVELCSYVSKIDPNTPILFYSAAVRQSDRTEAFEAGASDYLNKPADPNQLVSAAQSLIEQAWSRSLDARIAEIEAVRDVISERHERVAELLEKAEAQTLKLEAYRAFAAEGGNRANFERLWDDVYQQEVLAKNSQ